MNSVFYVFRQVPTTFGEFARHVEARAEDLGAYQGRVVGLWADNSPDFVINLFAIWKARATPFLISRRMQWSAVPQLLETAGAAVVIVTDVDGCGSSPVPVVAAAPRENYRSSGAEQGRAEEGPPREMDCDSLASPAAKECQYKGAELPPIGCEGVEPALILHTSGTTGQPKLAPLSRAGLLASLSFERARWQGIWTAEDATLGWLPLFHSFGLVSELLHAYEVRSRYYFGEANARALLALLESEPITQLSSVPWMLEQILDLPGGAEALSRLRWIVVGGAPVSEALGARVAAAGARLVQQHGMTEVGAVFRGDPRGGDWRDMFPVVPEQYWHLEGDGGQLIIHGDCPTLTSAARFGAFPTRDAFLRTESGAYRFHVRVDDVLVHVNGEKSNALTIEQMLSPVLRPDVERVVVVGAGRLRLACVLQWNRRPSPRDQATIRAAFDAVNAGLPAHSQLDPDLVLSVCPEDATRIPLSPKGTVIRERLLQEFDTELEQLYADEEMLQAAPGGDAVPLRARSGSHTRDSLRRLVREVAANVTGRSPDAIDEECGFAEQGFDSLMAVRVRAKLARALGIVLPASLLFDYPNVSSLAEHLGAELLGVSSSTACASALDQDLNEPIAIIGMACRFPGQAEDLEGYWQVLMERQVAVGEVPSDRWNMDDWYDPDRNASGRSYVKRASFLRDVQSFDAGFFHISPREALSLDPQQRLLLELSWEALERAMVAPSRLRRSSTGVFVGLSATDYAERVDLDDPSAGYATTGNAPSIAAGRLSFFLGLHGPCLAVDTACSSSLAAVHLACQSLRLGECSQAIAGAVNVLASPRTFVTLSRLGVLAPDGQCKPFSSVADGFGRAEGGAALVLKRHSDAVRDGDRIWAVIRSSAMNNDGASSGLTAPNGPAQQALVQQALRRGGLSASAVDYVECHGTGTLLGDPIELQALAAVYGEGRTTGLPLWIGGVKANLGHLEAAAGLAGLVKVVLALDHEVLPGQPPFEKLNPHVPWSSLELEVLREARAWPRGDRSRIAGVSSFGLGGTNLHVIVQEPPLSDPPLVVSTEPQVATPVLLSAETQPALRDQARQLLEQLKKHPEQRVADIAYSLCKTRCAFTQRAALVVDSRESLCESLELLASGQASSRTVVGAVKPHGRLAVLFTGQGSQRAQMGKALYDSTPVFRQALDRVFAAFSGGLDAPLPDVMFAPPGTPLADSLNRTEYTQPALFALEVALYRTLEQWGLRPALLMGHSIGELAAAHVAGVLSLSDAALLVTARGRLMQACRADGAMVSLEASEAEVVELLRTSDGNVDIAAINGPQACVVSGDDSAVREVQAHFLARGRKAVALQVSHAFHSPHMDSMLAEFERSVRSCRFGESRIPIVSNVTGCLASREQLASPQYWVEHARRAVRFVDGVRELEEQGVTAYLELGPNGTLTALARESATNANDTLFCSALWRARPERTTLLSAMGELNAVGHPLDWDAFWSQSDARKVSLPTYPYQRKRFWLETPTRRERTRAPAGRPLLGPALSVAGHGTVFSTELSHGSPGWSSGHRVFDQVMLPGTAFVEMAAAAGESVGANVVDNLTLLRPLVLPESGAVEVQTSVGPSDEQGQRTLSVYSRPRGTEQEWVLHATGVLARARHEHVAQSPVELGPWPPVGAIPVGLDGFYDRLAEKGFLYSDAFRGLRGVWQTEDGLYVEAVLPQSHAGDAARYAVHPALFDAALHALATPEAGEQLALPFEWSGVQLRTAGVARIRARITFEGSSSGSSEGAQRQASLVIWSEQGDWVGSVRSLTLRRPTPQQAASERGVFDPAYQVRWMAAPVAAPNRLLERVAYLADGSDEPGMQFHPSVAAWANAVAGGSAPMAGIVVLPCLAAETDVVRGARRHCNRVLEILKQWLSHAPLDSLRLVVLTQGAIAVRHGEDVPALAVAPLWGLVRSAEAEYPGRFILLDVDDCSDAAINRALAQVAAQEPLETQFALRGGELYVPRMVPPDLAPAGLRTAQPSGTRSFAEGTVLITGGMGTLGGLLAKHLVRVHGARHLVLCARRLGDATLKHELEAEGANVQLAQCDLGDRESVRGMLAEIPGEWPLVAVFHAAAALKDSVLMAHGSEHLECSFSGKLDGAYHLHQLTSGYDLAAFVMFSSISGVFGNAGQVSYSAANTFLDALAHHRRAQGLAGLSLAWGYWGERSGLTRHLGDIIIARMARNGVLPMETEHALGMLDDALAGDDALRVPVRLDVAALAKQKGAQPVVLRELLAAHTGPQARVANLRERLATLDTAAVERILLDIVTNASAVVMGVSPQQIEPHRPMTDLGLDSIMAVELRNRLESATSTRLAAGAVMDFPAPAVLAQRLRNALLAGRA